MGSRGYVLVRTKFQRALVSGGLDLQSVSSLRTYVNAGTAVRTTAEYHDFVVRRLFVAMFVVSALAASSLSGDYLE